MTLKKSCLLFFLLTSLALPASAWREGNGGDGVIMDQGLYLLDLVEAGSELDEEAIESGSLLFFQKGIEQLQAQTSMLLPQAELLSKFTQIYRKNKVLALALLTSFQELSWKWVQFPLKDIQDEGPNLTVPRELLVQLAFRVNQTVQIHQASWDRLNPRNQAALMFHEVLFALQIPERTSNGMDMNSPRVRTLVGFLFSKEFQQKSLDLVLRTEAPHLAFPTSLNPQIDPQWDAQKKYLTFNRQWFALLPHAGTQDQFELSPAGSSLTESWIQQLCEKALAKAMTFRFGLQAERVGVEFEKLGSGETEEFYLVPEYRWPHSLLTVEVPTLESLGACKNHLIGTMKGIQSQVLSIR